jgi:hypothetical protein
MGIILTALGAAFGACCVWLAVRIINRRERWAKWTLTAAIGVPALYVASFGPACWVSSRLNTESEAPVISIVYRPVTWAFAEPRYGAGPPPGKLEMGLRHYAGLFAKPGWLWMSIGDYDLNTGDQSWGPWEWIWSPPGVPPPSRPAAQ